MPGETDRLIELASRSANNAESELAAKSYLARRFEEFPPDDDSVLEAIAGFEHADRHPRRKYWKWGFYAVVVAVWIAILGLGIGQIPRLIKITTSLLSFGNGIPEFQNDSSPGDHLLLYGDENLRSRGEQWRRLWQSNPDDPVLLAQHATACFSIHKEFNDEILSAVQLTDPDNGWYDAMTASGLVESAIEKQKSSTSTSRTEIVAQAWTIRDPEKLQTALDTLHRAMAKPTFANYDRDIIRRRIPLLPPRTDSVSQSARIAYVAGMTCSNISMRKLADAVSAGAQECSKNGDVEGFKRIVEDWEKLSARLTTEGLTMVDLMIAKVFFFGPVENFRDAAKTLGMDEEVKRFGQLHELKLADKTRRSTRNWNSETDDLIMQRASLLGSLALPVIGKQVVQAPLLTEAELRPSRYTDHAMISRGFSLISMLPLGVAALLAGLHRFRQSPMHSSLSKRLEDLLRMGDWIWIFGCGILLPYLGYMAYVHFTSLSSREWSFKYTGFLHIYAEFVALWLMMLVISPLIAGWRINKRARAFHLKSPRRWLGITAAVAAVLAIPVAGLIVATSSFSQIAVYVASAPLLIPILWLLAGAVLTMINGRPHALRRGVLARVLGPAWVFGILVMTLSVPLHLRIEKHWIQQDRMFEVHAETPAMSTYEWDVTQVLRAEILEAQR